MDITDNISINFSLVSSEPQPPKNIKDIENSEVWNKYFYDLEQYHYQIMLNNYVTPPVTAETDINIQFKGIG